MAEHRRTWGFRLSIGDVVFLVAAFPATWFAWQAIGPIAGCIPMAVGHFFMFCNIFRVQRWKELVWAGTCLANVTMWAVFDNLWWPGILAVQTPLTIALIWTELLHPRYHGIFASRLNRHLINYLEHRT